MAWSIPSTLIVAGNGLFKSVVLLPRVTRRPCTLPLQNSNMAQGGFNDCNRSSSGYCATHTFKLLQFDSR